MALSTLSMAEWVHDGGWGAQVQYPVGGLGASWALASGGCRVRLGAFLSLASGGGSERVGVGACVLWARVWKKGC